MDALIDACLRLLNIHVVVIMVDNFICVRCQKNPLNDSTIRWCQQCKEYITAKGVDPMIVEANREVRVLSIALLNSQQALSYEDDYNQDLAVAANHSKI